MKSLDLWLRAISKYEDGGKRLSPFEGSPFGFIQCWESNTAASDLIIGCFTGVLMQGVSKEWTVQKQSGWVEAVYKSNALHEIDLTEAGCLSTRRLMLEGTGDTRELAVKCWTAFTKSVMKS